MTRLFAAHFHEIISLSCNTQVSTVLLSILPSSICLVLSDEWGVVMSQPLGQQKLICTILKRIAVSN